MAKAEHVNILDAGVEEWNRWRVEKGIQSILDPPDLREIEIRRT